MVLPLANRSIDVEVGEGGGGADDDERAEVGKGSCGCTDGLLNVDRSRSKERLMA